MAGEPSLFLVYKDFTTDERNSDSWHGTQALADAAATDGGVGFTAHQGALKVPENWATGWIYNPTDDKWRELGYADLDEVEQLKATAHTMMDVFQNALVFIAVHRSVWPDANVTNAREGIYWMSVNAARIALGTRTAARRGKFMEEAASWPDGVNGDVRQYVDAMTDSIALPTKDWSWVTPEMDPYTRVEVGSASATFGSATNVANAPSSEKLIGRDWINDIS